MRSQAWESKHRLTALKVLRNGRSRWIVFREIKENSLWPWGSENLGQYICPLIAEVIGDDFDIPRKTRGDCALGSVPESGDGVHKRTRNAECRHAGVDIEYDLSEGGENGGAEPLEGRKHIVEAILAILFRGEKVTITSNLNCHSGGALPDNKVKGGGKRMEIPPPLRRVGITISVQNGIDMTPQKGI